MRFSGRPFRDTANPDPSSDTHHDPNHIREAIPNPDPALTIQRAPDAGGRTGHILPNRTRYSSDLTSLTRLIIRLHFTRTLHVQIWLRVRRYVLIKRVVSHRIRMCPLAIVSFLWQSHHAFYSTIGNSIKKLFLTLNHALSIYNFSKNIKLPFILIRLTGRKK